MTTKALKWAEIIDAYRVWPRALIILYGWMVFEVTVWFMSLPDPNTAQAMLISTVWGASAAWFGVYVHSGRKWSAMQTGFFQHQPDPQSRRTYSGGYDNRQFSWDDER